MIQAVKRHDGKTMAQKDFVALSHRYACLDAKRDAVVEIGAIVPGEAFRPSLERDWHKPDKARKSHAGRKPMDAELTFDKRVVSALYFLPDARRDHRVEHRANPPIGEEEPRMSRAEPRTLRTEGRKPTSTTVLRQQPVAQRDAKTVKNRGALA